MRLAVIADVHGNHLALEAVIADMKNQAPDIVVDLGDCVSGPLWPREAFEMLAQLKALTVRGNHDRQVGTLPFEDMGASDRFGYGQLSAEQRQTLAALPVVREIVPAVFAFHSLPTSDHEYCLDQICDGRLVRAPLDVIEGRMGGFRAKAAFCGHSHRPAAVRLTNGLTVINPGSVGCPAYADDSPPHLSESGTPHARYAVVDMENGQVGAMALRSIAYAHEEAALRAEANDRPGWAYALRTGCAKS